MSTTSFTFQLQPLPLSPSILRRRAFEEARKQRIFDPKTRVIGLDLGTLESQRAEKASLDQARKEQERKWEQVADSRAQYERQVAQAYEARKQQQERELVAFNSQQAMLKSCIGAAEKDQESAEHLGVSSCQYFQGEDVALNARIQSQKEQMKVWCEQGKFERDLLKRREEEEKRYRIV